MRHLAAAKPIPLPPHVSPMLNLITISATTSTARMTERSVKRVASGFRIGTPENPNVWVNALPNLRSAGPAAEVIAPWRFTCVSKKKTIFTIFASIAVHS